MTTTIEAPTTVQCGVEALVQVDRGSATVECNLERGHTGWHEGALKDAQGETESLVTWR